MSYHDEQETLDNLKAWWARWGNALTWVVLAVLLVLAAWSGWHYWQRRQTTEAAALYEQFQQAVSANQGAGDVPRVRRITSDMTSSFGRTPYARMTALGAAAVLYRAKDMDGAKAELQWVIDHGGDSSYQQIARIRLAGVLLDQKAYDAGLALLSGKDDDGFGALRADRRGDLLAAAGKRDDARVAYRDALKQLASDDASSRQIVQLKLDALGG